MTSDIYSVCCKSRAWIAGVSGMRGHYEYAYTRGQHLSSETSNLDTIFRLREFLQRGSARVPGDCPRIRDTLEFLNDTTFFGADSR